MTQQEQQDYLLKLFDEVERKLKETDEALKELITKFNEVNEWRNKINVHKNDFQQTFKEEQY